MSPRQRGEVSRPHGQAESCSPPAPGGEEPLVGSGDCPAEERPRTRAAREAGGEGGLNMAERQRS